MLGDELHAGQQALAQDLEKALAPGPFPGGLERPLEQLHGPAKGKAEQPFLAAEVLEDGALGDGQPGGQAVHAGALEAVLGELLDGRVQHALALVLGKIGEGLAGLAHGFSLPRTRVRVRNDRVVISTTVNGCCCQW